jgi:hypothetical protein
MTCNELRERVDAYARDLLPSDEARQLELHLDSCQSCSEFLETREPAIAQVADLPRSIEPPPEAWTTVRRRLSPRQPDLRRFSLPAWALAAAAILLIVISSATTFLLLRRSPAPHTAQTPDRESPGLEAQYASATADLAAELAKAKSRLDPATYAVIERNLRVIDSALVESRRALASDPRNQVLEQLVVATWRQKMDFLRRATALVPQS